MMRIRQVAMPHGWPRCWGRACVDNLLGATGADCWVVCGFVR